MMTISQLQTHTNIKNAKMSLFVTLTPQWHNTTNRHEISYFLSRENIILSDLITKLLVQQLLLL